MSTQESALGQGIERTALLLRILGQKQDGLRLTDIALKSGLSKSTVHRLLGALTRVGLIEQDGGGNFHLSFEMFTLGMTAANRYGLVDLAHRHLIDLEERCHDTVYLSVRAGHAAICVQRIEGRFPIKVLTLSVGDRRPLGVGAGSLALLAFLPDEEIETMIAANAKEIAPLPGFDRKKLQRLVAESRKRDYSFNPGLLVSDMCAIGVPVFGPGERPIAAISIAAITARMRKDRREQLAVLLQTCAREIEKTLAELTSGMTPNGLRQLAAIGRGRSNLPISGV